MLKMGRAWKSHAQLLLAFLSIFLLAIEPKALSLMDKHFPSELNLTQNEMTVQFYTKKATKETGA